MTYAATSYIATGDSDEEGDDKGDAHTQIEGVLTKAGVQRSPQDHPMTCYGIVIVCMYVM